MAEEISCSEGEEADVVDMITEDEEELWRRVEREGFPREEISECGDQKISPEKKILTQLQGCGKHRHIQGEILDEESPRTREERSDDTEDM